MVERSWPACAVLVLSAQTAYANPRVVNPANMVGWVVSAGASLMLEVFVTLGVLFFAGVAVGPMFFALVVVNAVSYIGVLLPLYGAVKNILFVEAVIVAIETTLIKVLVRFDLFQGDSFGGLRWRYALLCALAGNACSYFMGAVMASASAA